MSAHVSEYQSHIWATGEAEYEFTVTRDPISPIQVPDAREVPQDVRDALLDWLNKTNG